MFDRSINLLEELDNISKVHWLDRDDIDTILKDFARRITRALRIERISIWLFNNDYNELVSMGEYDTRSSEFRKNYVLRTDGIPSYFAALKSNKILLVENVHEHEYTRELDPVYSLKHGVESLMDIPIRVLGELAGVICFEKTGEPKIFTPDEISFGLSISFVLSSNLEARHRRAAQDKLVKAIEEKDLLIREINHRVKNNFSILISMLRLSKDLSATRDPKIIFEEYEQRITSMLKIHDLLYMSGNYTSVNLPVYVSELVNEFRRSYPGLTGKITSKIDDAFFSMPTKSAIHIGLILSEIFLNSVKYAVKNTANYTFSVGLFVNEDKTATLYAGDNGAGFDFAQKLTEKTLGLSIINDLSAAIEADVRFPEPGSAVYSLTLKAS